MKRSFIYGVRVMIAVVFAGSGATALAGVAGYIDNNDRIPARGYVMVSPPLAFPSGVQINSFFDVFADFSRVPPPPPGGTQIDSFFDVFTEISISGAGPSVVAHPLSTATIRTTFLSGTPSTRTFNTEMLSLNLLGGDLPAGFMLRESPTRPSTGQTTITEVGGGNFRIDSFFDVFTELSLDGGQTWQPPIPTSGAMRLNGVLPEPTTLGVIAGIALTAMRRRR